jgi:hypothetical protein
MPPTVQFGHRPPSGSSPASPAAKPSDLPPWLAKSLLWFIGIVSCVMSIAMLVGARSITDQRLYLMGQGLTAQGSVVKEYKEGGGYRSIAPIEYHIVYRIALRDYHTGQEGIATGDDKVPFSDYMKVRTGDPIPVRYDPLNPSNNWQYLDGPTSFINAFLFTFGERGLFFTAIGLFTVFYAVRKLVRRLRRPHALAV